MAASQRDAGAEAIELTILMPCLNEAETIETCVRKAIAFLRSSGIPGEVLIADNGSSDGSQALAMAAGARVIAVPEKGYGAALIGGITDARGRYAIMGDADDSYDFSDLMPFVQRLRDGADLVMGNRFRGGIAPGAMPFLHRYLGNPVLSFLGRLFFRIPIRDFHCGLRGFNRDRMRELNLLTNGMEFASEMVVKSALSHYRVEEVPTTLGKDGRSRPPHLRTWRDGWRHLRFLLMFSPRYLYVLPGLALSLAGMIGATLLYRGPWQVTHGVTLDVHSYVFFVFLTIIGAQFLLFGVIARSIASAFHVKPPSGALQRGISRLVSLEHLLVLALLLLLGGIAGAWYCFAGWQHTGFSALVYGEFLKPFIASLAAVLLAAQIMASAFFASSIVVFSRHQLPG
jgi:glycosyltransferase involved in cell wall biosynthesis